MTTSHTLAVPGAEIHYEVRGAGPVLVLAGSPMGAGHFAPAAGLLADRFTVVTHDPRGIGRSTLADPEQISTPEVRADDVAALLDALGAADADVFGSSGGAVTGLALVARHPARVRTLVAHEPPVLDVLPDAGERHAGTEEIIATFHRDGPEAAFLLFLTRAGYTEEDLAALPADEPSAQDAADTARFLAYELRWTTRYVPDVAALRSAPGRVLIGVGAESGKLVTAQTSAILAARLGTVPVEFPGEHTGFLEQPAAFAERLAEVLR